MSGKCLISNIYNQLIQFNIKKKKINDLPFKKNGRTECTFSQRRHADGHQVHEKLLDIITHQENAKQDNNELSPHTCQSGYHQKEHESNC